jgi:hypothetical protein
MEQQNYAKHAKWVPMYHFVLFAVVVLAFIGSLVNLYQHVGDPQERMNAVLFALLGISALLLFFFLRNFATKNQDRIIRTEENFRHYVLTGKVLEPRLTVDQIIGLRFASDGEFAELAKRAADEGLSRDAIKKAVKNWRPDHNRV